MQGAGLSDPFYRGDLIALVHHGKAEAGVHPPAIDVHGASTALTVITPLLGARQENVFTQAVQQCGPRVDLKPVFVSIDPQRNGHNAISAGR
jgi:hypothetical protein